MKPQNSRKFVESFGKLFAVEVWDSVISHTKMALDGNPKGRLHKKQKESFPD